MEEAKQRTVIARSIKEDIDQYCESTYNNGHRSHLGASMIGEDCQRKLWYSFRWAFDDNSNGRKQRLFNRGHLEESRFVEWLAGIGAQVWQYDENGEQFRISAVEGHFGGSMDGIALLPEKYGISEKVLLEFKTHGTGAAFSQLCKQGVEMKYPKHYAQMCTYGYSKNLNYALYMCINKNDDDLHVELVKLRKDIAEQQTAKAQKIISADTAPPKLSDNPTYFICSWCAAKNVCHNHADPVKNCRSCKFAVPVENAQWKCNFYSNVIPKDFLPIGCNNWSKIK